MSSFQPEMGRCSRGERRVGLFLSKLAALALAGLAAGCNMSGSDSLGDAGLSARKAPVTSQPPAQANATPSQIGTGPVRVGLILPLTQGTGPSTIGQSLLNAAQLAVNEAGSSDITLLVQDDQSSPDGAKAAASAVLANGAQLIIGPVYAPNVQAVGSVAQAAGRPVIAFSTDTSVATHGVYLLSFLAENYVDRIVNYAAENGKKSFAALIPDNQYGRIAEAELQQATARRGIRIEDIEHYSSPSQVGPAAQAVAAAASQIDTLFIPEQADAMPAVAQALSANKLDAQHIQILGTGLWNDPRVLALPALQGAWFAGPDPSGFNAFAQRYRTKYGSDPARIATLSYDAVSLAIALTHTQNAQPFANSVLTNPAGFNGADGIFRFRPDGTNERGLAVFAIRNGTATIISPAPRSFDQSVAAGG